MYNEWSLKKLYKSPDDPQIDEDMKKAKNEDGNYVYVSSDVCFGKLSKTNIFSVLTKSVLLLSFPNSTFLVPSSKITLEIVYDDVDVNDEDVDVDEKDTDKDIEKDEKDDKKEKLI